MSSFFYFIVELYPWWAVPMALIIVEVGMHFRRTARPGKAILCVLIAGLLVALAALFIWYNGVQNVRPAMQKIENKYF